MDVLKYADINPDDAKHMAQRLHRKKDDLNFVRKVFTVDKVEAIDDERSIVARVSTNDRDRDGEIVEPKGIDLSNYTKNPCLLWAHKYDVPAIGKALWSKTDDKGLICKFQFAPTQFADEIYQLYKGGYQKAFSIGFIPMDFDSVEKVHRKVSLLEVSAVPVPANEDALVLEAYTKGIIKSDQLMSDLQIEIEDTPAPAPVEEKAEVVTKPETTENYHRIPVSEGHEGHRIRTITISADEGIKALYCGTCKEVVTYLFDVDKFTMAEARTWVEEHKKSVVITENSDGDIDGSVYTPIAHGIVSIPSVWGAKEAPDLASELASLRQDVAAILARLQVTPEPVQAVAPLPAPPPIVPEEITIDAEPEIEVEGDALAPEKSAEELVEAYIKSGDFDKAVAEAVTVALAKLRGRVI